MPHSYQTTRRIEFAETDMAGLVHFSNFHRYMEATEHAFYREIGLILDLESFEASWGLPRVRVECDYLSPARFQDLLEIRLLVLARRARVVHYAFAFQQAQSGVLVARGELVVCCVKRDPSARHLTAAPFPPEFQRLVEEAPQELIQAFPGSSRQRQE